MKSYYAKISEIVEGKSESPFPLEVIPNSIGINLCSVDAISWQRCDDGQIVNICIYFLPG